MRRTAAVAVLVAGAVSAPAFAVDWQLHGFLSQGFALSEGNNAFGTSEDGSLDYYEVGANGLVMPLPGLIASAQVLARRAGESDDGSVRLDYGLLDWRFLRSADTNLGVRGGRVKNPFGLYNDARDVVFARPGYDPKGNQYFIYWTAEVNKTWSTASIHYSTTKDFKHFSQPQILFKDSVGILDANLVFANGVYHLFYRKSNSIWVVTSPNALGPYGDAFKFSHENVEGPFVFPLRDTTGYGIVFDYYGGSAGFGLMTSPDFKNWSRITNRKAPFYNDKVRFPAGIRHGAVFGITKKELRNIEKAFIKK